MASLRQSLHDPLKEPTHIPMLASGQNQRRIRHTMNLVQFERMTIIAASKHTCTSCADIDGNVHIKNMVDTGDLPIMSDENYPGAKIWLVLSPDVDCMMQEMIGWNPAEYLFEYDLITFDDTDF